MLKIAICDDCVNEYDILLSYINEWKAKVNQQVTIDYFSSAEEFLFYWPEEKDFEIIFLDIEMKSITGMELAKRIREIDENIIIIFVTGYQNYVFDGYSVRALNYILKPIDTKQCFETLDNALKEINNKRENKYYILRNHRSSRKIKLDDIIYMIMFSHYIDIVTDEEVIKYKIKIGEIENELPYPSFIRCHRSYIVNLNYVESILSDKLILKDGLLIPISKKKWKDVNKAFIECHLL